MLQDKKFDWNLRVFVARNLQDEGEVTGAVGRVGPWGVPTNWSYGARFTGTRESTYCC